MANASKYLDAIVVGAGFGGLYMVHLLRNSGFSVKAFERGSGVGGTWYWNRYPGCRCDVESMDYSYQFSDDLQQQWQWSERYSAQPEILAYANHVADEFDLRSAYQFETNVTAARFDEARQLWQVSTDRGELIDARYLIMATGCLSAANMPKFAQTDVFQGQIYHTGAWPQDGVDFSDKKVAVIGTGSSAIQSIPHIAAQAQHLTVFQRTPNYSIPAQNGPIDAQKVADIKANYSDYRARNQMQPAAFGADFPRCADSVLDASADERQRRFEEYWQHGGFMFMSAFGDLSLNEEANFHAAEFVRNKIRSIVIDPATAELLCPTTIIGCKRLCADTGYFETFNRDNVSLVDVSQQPIDALTADGLNVAGREFMFDAIVFATGFDAMTGALLNIDIQGVAGKTLQQQWSAGPSTYLGLMTAGFPNLFMMTGPGSPSVLANMITGIEQHANYINELLLWARERQITQISASEEAQASWVSTVNMRAQETLYPRCNSWYLGANVPGKPRVFMPYVGYPAYVQRLTEIRDNGYEGFVTAGTADTVL